MILSAEQIAEKLLGTAGWEYSNNQILKTYKLKDFNAVIKLVSSVASAAEQLQHHPDIDIRYNKVTFTLSTHSEKGITEKDFQMAAEIEKAAQGI